MAQPSVANYFNTRKRTALDEAKSATAKKVLVLDKNLNHSVTSTTVNTIVYKSNKLNNVCESVSTSSNVRIKKIVNNGEKQNRKVVPKRNTRNKSHNVQKNIQQYLQSMFESSTAEISVDSECNNKVETEKEAVEIRNSVENNASKDIEISNSNLTSTTIMENQINSSTSEKAQPMLNRIDLNKNAMDKININNTVALANIKKKLTRSEKLAELKASISRFKESEKKLEKIEERTSKINVSPSLKNFKNIELEVQLSPQKLQSPNKLYLSPKKDTSVRRNILNFKSPSKNAVELSFSPSKLACLPESKSLSLPFKYKHLLEIFRSLDTVSQIMYNRKETITFKKLKPAIEEMLKKNIMERHLGQIKHLYPEAYEFRQEKLREFGTGKNSEKWELVVHPNINAEHMTSEIIVERRKKLFEILIEKTKDYHEEFLNTLNMKIPREKIRHWHPEFDIEKVPDIDIANLPQLPIEEKFHTGKEVLAKARSLFHCNTRMEAALERLEQKQQTNPEDILPKKETPLMKGIPKALLEKVRQRQAAKMLQNMTRSNVKEEEIQLYSRLPELARLTRNLFVAEKKSVLPLDIVINKLNNSFRTFLTKLEMEQHLKTISAEVPGWLVFHEVRNAVYIKVSKNADLNLVMNKLEDALKEKEKS